MSHGGGSRPGRSPGVFSTAMSCIIPIGMFMVFAMILAKIVKRAGVMGELAKWAWGGSRPDSWSSTRGMGSARRRVGRYKEDLGKVLDPNPQPAGNSIISDGLRNSFSVRISHLVGYSALQVVLKQHIVLTSTELSR